MRHEITVLGPDLQVGDVVLSAGISGVVGQVVRVSVGPACVGVWLADGSIHSIGVFEAVDVERELRAEAA